MVGIDSMWRFGVIIELTRRQCNVDDIRILDKEIRTKMHKMRYMGEAEIMTILEKMVGRLIEARQPIMPDTEWPTKMQEET